MIQLPNNYADIETNEGGFVQLQPATPYVLKVCAVENKTDDRFPTINFYGDIYDPTTGKVLKSYTDDTPDNAWRHRYGFRCGVFQGDGIDWKKLKNLMARFEQSNAGFTFTGDEQKVVGLYIGIVLRDRSYLSKQDGSVKHVLEPAQWLTTEDAKAGKFLARLCEPKVGAGVAEAEAAKAATPSAPATPSTADLANEDIPF